MNKEKIILGIDPGTILMGYGVIKITNNKLDLLSMGAIELKKFDNQNLKLKRIAERTKSLIESYCPDECAIEAPFMGKNAQSMLKLGRAQGVAMATSLIHDIPITEYSPRKIKQAVTGSGNASKEQVAEMLKNIFKLSSLPKYLDATDGLATAFCHYICSKEIYTTETKKSSIKKVNSKKSNSWDNFVKDNPNRISKS